MDPQPVLAHLVLAGLKMVWNMPDLEAWELYLAYEGCGGYKDVVETRRRESPHTDDAAAYGHTMCAMYYGVDIVNPPQI